VKEFLEIVESSTRIGSWSDFEKIQIAVLKITEVSLAFYNSNPELHNAGISWENFKAKICRDLEMLEVTNINLCNF
jgi:hypothetical protein